MNKTHPVFSADGETPKYVSPETGTEYRADIDGFAVRWTSRGFCVLEVDYWCDPSKTAEWAAKERRKYTERQWKREMLRDWTTAAGDAFFPEFTLRPDHYTMRIPGIAPGTVVRGWDFGYRGQACVWMQVLANGRVLMLRELLGQHIEIHEFRDLVMYISGQIPLELLQERKRLTALKLLDKIVNKKGKPWNRYPKPPWFKGVREWKDYAGHEANATAPIHTMHNDKPETNAKDVLVSGGIQLQAGYVRKSSREYIFRRLLGSLEDGGPALLIDPMCVLLKEGFNGALAYPKPTPKNPKPQEIARDGKYEHLYDAAGYGVANIVSVTEDRDIEVEPNLAWKGRVLVDLNKEESFQRVESYNTRRDLWSAKYA